MEAITMLNGKPSISIRAIYTMAMLNSKRVLVQWRIFQLATCAPRNLRGPRRASLLKDLRGIDFPPVIDRKGPVLKKYQFYINATVTTILLYNQKHNNEPSPISPDMNFIETMLKQDVYDHKFLWYLISGPMIALGCWYVLTSVAAMQQIPKLINIELSPSVSNIYIYTIWLFNIAMENHHV